MKALLSSALIAAVLVAAPDVSAAKRLKIEKQALFRFSKKNPVITGYYSIGGYSEKQLRKFISARCKGGKIGPITLAGEPKKKRGEMIQEFQTSCPAGMGHPVVGGQGHFSVFTPLEGEYAGKTLIEWTVSRKDVGLQVGREIVKP